MNWKKINAYHCMILLREIEKHSLTLTPDQSITFSDGFEELTITYKRLKEKKQ